MGSVTCNGNAWLLVLLDEGLGNHVVHPPRVHIQNLQVVQILLVLEDGVVDDLGAAVVGVGSETLDLGEEGNLEHELSPVDVVANEHRHHLVVVQEVQHSPASLALLLQDQLSQHLRLEVDVDEVLDI